MSKFCPGSKVSEVLPNCLIVQYVYAIRPKLVMQFDCGPLFYVKMLIMKCRISSIKIHVSNESVKSSTLDYDYWLSVSFAPLI